MVPFQCEGLLQTLLLLSPQNPWGQTVSLPGFVSSSLSWLLSHLLPVSASAHLSLSAFLPPLFPLPHPYYNWEHHPCPRTV